MGDLWKIAQNLYYCRDVIVWWLMSVVFTAVVRRCWLKSFSGYYGTVLLLYVAVLYVVYNMYRKNSTTTVRTPYVL